MSNFQNKYKGKPFGFANIEESRSIRAEKHSNRRKTERTKTFNENRNILNNPMNSPLTEEPNISAAVENRMARLFKWKIERDRRRKLEQAKKKRPFVVGKVHHKVYSPITKDEHIISTTASKKVFKSNVPTVPSIPQKRITRATEKRLMQKAQLNKIKNAPTKIDHSVKNKHSKLSKKQEQSFAPANYKFKPPENLKRLPLFGRVTNSISDSFNESFMSFARVSRVSRKSCSTNVPAEPINSTALNTSYTIEKKQDDETEDDNVEEDSIEPIVLKLSSDDENVFNSCSSQTTRSKKNNNATNNDVSKKDKETNIKFNDSKKSTKFSDSKKIEKFNDSKKSEKFNDSKKNEKFNDSKKSEKFNDSEKNEKFNDSKKSEKLNDSNRSKKFNNFKKNKDINQKLNNSYKDNESNAIVNDYSEQTQPSSNKDKLIQHDFSNELIFLPPYVVSRHGENNARKEQQKKCSFNLNCTTNDYTPTKELVMKNLNISTEEEERTAQYFELLLNKEIDRQNQLCEKWTKIKEEPEIAEDAQYQINQAIGQTNLLMNKKFVKFRNLISDCATEKGEMLVTCNDLQGFWDVMYIEIEDCNLRFEKLEQLRSRGWEEEEVIAVNKPCTRKKVAATKKTVRTKPSGIRAFLEKRKQNMVGGTQSDETTENFGVLNNETLSSKYENNENSPNFKCKSRSSNKTRLSSLRKLQFSETKMLKSPLTMMKISQMCKTPEIQLDDTTSYIYSHQTPSKSILKQSKYSNQIGSSMKSAQKVNFNDIFILNKDTVDDEAQRKKNLAAALVKIDNLDFDCVSNETPIRAEKKLTFNDDSFEESPNIFDVSRNSDSKKYENINMCTQKTIPNIKIEAATPLQKSMLHCRSSTPSLSNKLTRQNAFDEDNGSLSFNIAVSTPFKDVDNTDLNESKQKLQKHVSVNKKEETAELSDNIKVLRNRTIIPGNTPIQKRRYSRNRSMNVQELECKENETPTRAKSKTVNEDSTKVDTLINSEVDLYDGIRGMSLEESYGRRRSSRRSVKFSEKECSGCVEKLTFSVTPHVRRSKAQSTEKKRTAIAKESIETTEKLPERVRRSKSKKV